ncbi:MAG: hypothetical protein E6R04_07665 [Spirochaetes bacterium]|nr:MAG: hypothetical protein E6R04_07665 [Spirochaetota bacterium]
MTETDILSFLPNILLKLEEGKNKILSEHQILDQEDEVIDLDHLWNCITDPSGWFVADSHDLPAHELTMILNDLLGIPSWCCGMSHISISPSDLVGAVKAKTWVLESKHEDVADSFDLAIWTVNGSVVAWDFR